MRQDIEETADLLVVENNSDSVKSVEMHKRINKKLFQFNKRNQCAFGTVVYQGMLNGLICQ